MSSGKTTEANLNVCSILGEATNCTYYWRIIGITSCWCTDNAHSISSYIDRRNQSCTVFYTFRWSFHLRSFMLDNSHAPCFHCWRIGRVLLLFVCHFPLINWLPIETESFQHCWASRISTNDCLQEFHCVESFRRSWLDFSKKEGSPSNTSFFQGLGFLVPQFFLV